MSYDRLDLYGWYVSKKLCDYSIFDKLILYSTMLCFGILWWNIWKTIFLTRSIFWGGEGRFSCIILAWSGMQLGLLFSKVIDVVLVIIDRIFMLCKIASHFVGVSNLLYLWMAYKILEFTLLCAWIRGTWRNDCGDGLRELNYRLNYITSIVSIIKTQKEKYMR